MNADTTQLSSAEKLERRIALFVVFTPVIGLIAAIILLWGRGVGPVDLALCFVFYMITGLGITAGYHRYFTHRSFETNNFIKVFLGVSGSMAAQGPIMYWTAVHRRHHQFSDKDMDPHSPHSYGEGLWQQVQGFWHAHVGWMLNLQGMDWIRIVRDLLRDRWVMWMNKHYLWLMMLGLILPAVLGGLLTMSWFGALTGFLWGGLVRIFLVHHTTWSINSICHLFGGRPYDTSDESRNNFLCALFAFGEGWHNNHHAFPTSARHGFYWWQIDTTYLFLLLLQKLGLAWDLKIPDEDAREAKRSRLRGATNSNADGETSTRGGTSTQSVAP